MSALKPYAAKVPEVRALLAGATMLWMPVDPQPSANHTKSCACEACEAGRPEWRWYHRSPGKVSAEEATPHLAICPFAVGDRFFVQEAFGFTRQDDDINGRERVVWYEAGHPYSVTDAGVDCLKRGASGEMMQPNHYAPAPDLLVPAHGMPEWSARLAFEVVGVEVRRLGTLSLEILQKSGVTVEWLRSELEAKADKSDWALPYWVQGHANGECGTFCRNCIEAAAEKAKGEVDGGWVIESDCPEFCDTCEVPIEVTLTKHGGLDELDHYESHGISDAPLDARSAIEMLNALECAEDCNVAERLLRVAYRHFYKSIHGPWDPKTWCWALTIKRIEMEGNTNV